MRRMASFAAFAALALAVYGGPASAAAGGSGRATAHRAHVPLALPVNANYADIKARIDAAAPSGGVGTPRAGSLAPAIGSSFQGQGATVFSPSDATGAIGPT